MNNYFLKEIKVKKLWGFKDIELCFNQDVNIIIGPNASGKTTILNLLRYILTFNPFSLLEIPFEKVIMTIKEFGGEQLKNIVVSPTKVGFDFNISGKNYPIELESIPHQHPRYIHRQRKLIMQQATATEINSILKDLVPAIWLPVSRRLPISEEQEEDIRYEHRANLESVDERLRELIKRLSSYRMGLNASLSERYKEFQRRVFEIILYSKDEDTIQSKPILTPTKKEKDKLIEAFKVVGLLDSQMQKRIDDHFKSAKEALNRIKKADTSKINFRKFLNEVFIIPLIGRTNRMVQFAKELEQDRREIFAPLSKYEEIVNSFLEGKKISVSEIGVLKIESSTHKKDELMPHFLSSGEKQIVILLTEALLSESKPIVYVVDEPELSLHVKWQEKLLKSLQSLGKQIQIIVATHSPDIVGEFRDKLIDLGRTV